LDQKDVNAEMQQVSAYATKHKMHQHDVVLLEEKTDDGMGDKCEYTSVR
jgi:galactitol-specific phosphotransferase system IIB component